VIDGNFSATCHLPERNGTDCQGAISSLVGVPLAIGYSNSFASVNLIGRSHRWRQHLSLSWHQLGPPIIRRSAGWLLTQVCSRSASIAAQRLGASPRESCVESSCRGVTDRRPDRIVLSAKGDHGPGAGGDYPLGTWPFEDDRLATREQGEGQANRLNEGPTWRVGWCCTVSQRGMGEALLPGRAVRLRGRPRALGVAFGRAAKEALPIAREFLAGKSLSD
jgi:hypothetical protein